MRVLEQRREMLVAEENRDGTRGKGAVQMPEAKLAELRRADGEEVLDRFDVLDELQFLGRECGAARHFTFEFLFLEVQ